MHLRFVISSPLNPHPPQWPHIPMIMRTKPHRAVKSVRDTAMPRDGVPKVFHLERALEAAGKKAACSSTEHSRTRMPKLDKMEIIMGQAYSIALVSLLRYLTSCLAPVPNPHARIYSPQQ